ncbi:MAG: hypothetical protein WC613_06150 [Candidatus Aenigmatarchaeota archaeon]
MVRGDWSLYRRDDRRVDVHADSVPADQRFAAWLVDEQPNILTPDQYAGLERRVSARKKELETELATLEKELASAAVLVE